MTAVKITVDILIIIVDIILIGVILRRWRK